MRTKRLAGSIPAIVYGAKADPRSVWVSRLELEKAMRSAHSANVLFKLDVATQESGQTDKISTKKSAVKNSGAETVLLKSLQRDPATEVPVHVDFVRVDVHKKVEIEVAVHVTGNAVGVKDHGGILEHIMREVKVRCLPTHIPEAIAVDVSDLDIGQGVVAGDLNLPDGVELVTDAGHILINVVTPTKEEEPAPAAATAAEPEVITKGKKEETPEGAAAATAKPSGPAAAKQPAPAAPAKTETPKK